ncbi:MAG: hypothetical protein KJ977_05465 [Candidatus Omnitrophica bacterium]|nr:hypothetical protein [Candidatus Omnitrophota bacterium]MBU2266472.1 hypothetical protein [Candidatus Omnitrophota bacterium]
MAISQTILDTFGKLIPKIKGMLPLDAHLLVKKVEEETGRSLSEVMPALKIRAAKKAATAKTLVTESPELTNATKTWKIGQELKPYQVAGDIKGAKAYLQANVGHSDIGVFHKEYTAAKDIIAKTQTKPIPVHEIPAPSTVTPELIQAKVIEQMPQRPITVKTPTVKAPNMPIKARTPIEPLIVPQKAIAPTKQAIPTIKQVITGTPQTIEEGQTIRGNTVKPPKAIIPPKLQSLEFVKAQETSREYRSAHQLSLSDSITADKIDIPKLKEKIRTRNGYLNNYNLSDLRKLEKLQNNPEGEITIYRASPKKELNDGDWVTTDKFYANDIKKQNGGKVYSYKVKIKDLRFPKDTESLPSLSMASTFAYSPKTSQLTDIYNQAVKVATAPIIPVKAVPLLPKAALPEKAAVIEPTLPQSVTKPIIEGTDAIRQYVKGIITKKPTTTSQDIQNFSGMTIIHPATGEKISLGTSAELAKTYREVLPEMGLAAGKDDWSKPIRLPMAGGQSHKGKMTQKGETLAGIQSPIKITNEMKIVDSKGKTKTLPVGEEFTPYLVVNNIKGKPPRVVLQDGQRVSITPKQFKEVKASNVQLGDDIGKSWQKNKIVIKPSDILARGNQRLMGTFPNIEANPFTTNAQLKAISNKFGEPMQRYYVQQSHNESIRKGMKLLMKDPVGTEKTLLDKNARWSDDISAAGVLLIDHYKRLGDAGIGKVLDILDAIQIKALASGRANELLKMLKTMDSTTILKIVDKTSLKNMGKVLPDDIRKQFEKNMRTILGMPETTAAEIAAKQQAIAEQLNKMADEMYAQTPLMKKIGSWMAAYRYQNMLSGPLTTVRNVTSGLFNTFILHPLQILGEATYDIFRHPFNPMLRDMKFSDAPKYVLSTFSNFNLAVESSVKMFKSGTLTNKTMDIKLANSILDNLVRSKIPKPLTIVPRFMEAQDNFFSVLIGQGEKARLMANGVDEAVATEKAMQLAQQYMFREQLGKALKDQNEPFFVHALDWLGKIAMQGREAPWLLGHAWGWFVPFITTPTNIAKQTVRYSPLGFIMSPANYTKTQIVRAGIGSVACAYGAIKASTGETTWSPPKDAKLRAEWYAAGNQPYCIKVTNPATGKKYSISMMYLMPFSLSIALPAAIAHQQMETKEKLSDSQLQKISKAILEISKYTTTQTSLSGMEGFLKILEGDIDYKTGSQLGFVSEQVLPLASMVKYINTLVDPIFKKTHTFWETWRKDYPPVSLLSGQPMSSKDLPPILSDTGQPVKRLPINQVIGYPIGLVDEGKQAIYLQHLEEAQRRYAEKNKRQRTMKKSW